VPSLATRALLLLLYPAEIEAFFAELKALHKEFNNNYQCQGTKVPGNEGSRERKFSSTKVP